MTKKMVIEYKGERLTLAEVSARCGIDPATIRARIMTYGYTVERATSFRIRLWVSGL